MERLLFVWDELDDWAGIARHYASSAFAGLSLRAMPVDTFTLLAFLPTLLS